MFKNILIAMDGSDNSYDALGEALVLATKFQSKLFLVSVVNIANLPTNVGVSYVPELERDLKKDSKKILSNSQDIVKANGLTCNAAILSGDPRDELIDFAKNKQIDLIIMGKSGVHALERFFAGSVTRYISEHSDRSVLIVS